MFSVSHPIIGLLVLFVIALMLLWFVIIKPTKESEPRSEEWWATRSAEIELEKRTEEFTSLFGFNPKLMSQNRYQKEVLLQLSILAKELMNKGKEVAEYPHIYRDSYNELSKEYADMLGLIGFFEPDLQKDIPHWTELPEFMDGWLNGKRCRTSKSSATVECL